MSFETRSRYTEEEARSILAKPASVIQHLLKNIDGTFSVMSHIVCEWCDYCDEQGDCRGNMDAEPVNAKCNPYEQQERMERDDYLEGWQECRKELVRWKWIALEYCTVPWEIEKLSEQTAKEIEEDMRRLIEQEAARMEQND